MIKKIFYISILFALIISIYLIFLFDINNFKKDLEDFISKKANVDFTINGNIDLDLGINTHVRATELIIKKNTTPVISAEVFQATVSISKIINGIFDINSISLKNSKLYGINIDDKIVQTYNALAGRRYVSNNPGYSLIELITAKGYFQGELLHIDNIKIQTELLNGEGFGKINPSEESINISSNTFIRTNAEILEKYNNFYPDYLVDVQLPVLLTGNYTNPDIDIKISDVIIKKLKNEIKDRTFDIIRDKLKDKIQSEINIKLPF